MFVLLCFIWLPREKIHIPRNQRKKNEGRRSAESREVVPHLHPVLYPTLFINSLLPDHPPIIKLMIQGFECRRFSFGVLCSAIPIELFLHRLVSPLPDRFRSLLHMKIY